MRRNIGNAAYFAENHNSILDHDQLDQIVSRNKSFLKDFILVMACLVVFVLLIVFILLLYNYNRMSMLVEKQRKEKINTFLMNLDRRVASAEA
uniref:Ac104 n=1 Tax=Malacosoma sp. alphabaculovirus TaxID=1881632 RepID=A0A1B1V5J1_9ABAC|nr:ac104 [Malacosoma sp. alphabaculovirus]